MDTTTLSSLADLSDQDLLARVMELAADERRATALLIAHLAELDARRLYLAEGYSSLFIYCTQALRLSEHAAYGRIEAARTVRRFPAVLEMLVEGAVTLTTVGLLAPHLTAENHRDLLDRARHKSKRAVEEVIAALCPRPPAPAVVRRLPAAGRRPAPTLPGGAPAGPEAPPTPPPERSATVVPLAPQRYRVQFTARAETYEKLRLAQALLRHQIPHGDLDQVFHRGPDGAAGKTRQGEVCRHGAAPCGPPHRPRLAPHPGRGQAGRVAPGRGAVRVRGEVGTPLHGGGLPGVPPREAVRGGRRVHGRQHPATLSRPQCVRRRAVLRSIFPG